MRKFYLGTWAVLACLLVGHSAVAAPLEAAAVQASFPETTARPLFAQTRRPVPVIVPEQVAVVAPAEEILEPTLVSLPADLPSFDGTGLSLRGVIGRTGALIALIEQSGGTEPFRVGLGVTKLPGTNGQPVDVEVLEISASHVILRADQPVTLTLRPKNETADDVSTVIAQEMIALAPKPALEPVERVETIAAHSPTGVLKTSLFTISATN